MAVPKQKHTKSRRNKRRSQIFLKAPKLATCPKCSKDVLPYTICQNCGFYKGREVINVLEKLGKKERKIREKELAAKEEEKGQASDKSLNWEDMSRK